MGGTYPSSWHRLISVVPLEADHFLLSSTGSGADWPCCAEPSFRNEPPLPRLLSGSLCGRVEHRSLHRGSASPAPWVCPMLTTR